MLSKELGVAALGLRPVPAPEGPGQRIERNFES
jgi:hypothetical protein